MCRNVSCLCWRGREPAREQGGPGAGALVAAWLLTLYRMITAACWLGQAGKDVVGGVSERALLCEVI